MSWWQRLRQRERLEAELERELGFHLRQHADELGAAGAAPAQAARRAGLALGGAEQVAEACRDARGTRWLEDLGRDLRLGLRGMRQRPGFTAVLLATLGLGIGATTLMYSVARGVLLAPPPFAHPSRLLALQEWTDQATRWGNSWAFAGPNYTDLARSTQTLQVGAWRYTGGILSQPGEAEYVDGSEISAGLLAVLGLKPLRGRGFSVADDHVGAAPVALISPELWQRHFGGQAGVVGARLEYDGRGYTVIGIAPPALAALAGYGSDSDIGIYLPLGQDPDPRLQYRALHPGLEVAARLDAGVSLEQARAELAAIGHRLAARYPASNAGRTFVAHPLQPDVGTAGATIWLLFGAVGLVLLIACVNAASLLLAHGTARQREMAMRVALGAGRGRLVRQCLTESAVLALGGAALGVLLAGLGLRPFLALWPAGLPRAAQVHLDGHVLLFTTVLALTCGLLFGLAPALRVPSQRVEARLRGGSRTGGSGRCLHAGFVVAEVGLALVLLVAAGILGRALLRLVTITPGFDTDHVLVARTALAAATLANPAQTRNDWNRLLERVRAVPGVEAAAMVDTVPLREGNNQVGYWLSPAAPPPAQQPLALATCVSADYFRALGIPLRQGRYFGARDRLDAPPVVLIDEVLARHAFGRRDPIGQHIWIGLSNDPQTIVGVVGHVKYFGPAGDASAAARDEVYNLFDQLPDPYVKRWSQLMSLAVRTRVPPLTVLAPLRTAVAGAGGEQVLYEIRTMDQLARSALAQQRFLMALFGVFAGLALLLACVGVYGVQAYWTAQRVPEIGVRMALGARPLQVAGMVLRASVELAALGAAIGLVVAAFAGRLLAHAVAGIDAGQPGTYAAMAALLLLAALAASLPPALRASRTDPVQALRRE